MKIAVLEIVCGCIMMVSCANEKKNTPDIRDAATNQVTAPDPTLSTQNTISSPVSTPPAVIPSAPAAAGALNPAHGQPGHRCDIAVGAPLNSPPNPAKNPAPLGTANAPLGTATPSFTPPPVLGKASTPVPTAGASATNTAPGMNPPHGQPGHDCSIAVGAPLKK